MSYRRKNGTGGITKMSGKRNNPYRVRITETFVVDPFDHSIRTQGEREELTLFTCAEKGTKRFVVKCVPASEEGTYEE